MNNSFAYHRELFVASYELHYVNGKKELFYQATIKRSEDVTTEDQYDSVEEISMK